MDQPNAKGDVRERVVALRTSEASNREAKAPWKGELLAGRAEGVLLFRTAISRNVIPFALVDPPLVVLPVLAIRDAKENGTFKVLTAEQLLEAGYRYGSTWFLEAEKRWDKKKTDKNREMKTTLPAYLDWQTKLSEQNPDAKFLVLYTSSATDASAVVVDRRQFDHPFIVDHKTYWCECTSESEAHFVAAYVNSNYANDKIKEFQSRGLFGPRDIHKLIVKLPFPKFQKGEAKHEALAELGRKCATLANNFVRISNVEDLQARALGVIRARIKDQLEAELAEIDALVSELSDGTSGYERKPRKKSRGSRAIKMLFD